jgi:hypothetical protein
MRATYNRPFAHSPCILMRIGIPQSPLYRGIKTPMDSAGLGAASNMTGIGEARLCIETCKERVEGNGETNKDRGRPGLQVGCL